MDGRSTRAEGLLQWAVARNATVDVLESMGLPTDDGWPPYWGAPIPQRPEERRALEVLAALRLDGGDPGAADHHGVASDPGDADQDDGRGTPRA